MNKDRAEGKVKEGSGWVKDKVGEATGDHDLEAQGEAERTEGKVQGAVGKVKEAVGDVKDAIADKLHR